MTPRRVVIFRFDRDPLVCRSRVALLRRLNPGVAIHGIFGGDPGLKQRTFRQFAKPFLWLDGVFWSRRGGRWNWQHGDLALAAWYRELGRHVEFDVAHYVEWDLLLLDSLERLYARVPANAVGLTTLTPLDDVAGEWTWLIGERRREWEQLLADVRRRWGYDGVPHACWAVGPVLPRSFLSHYAELEPPELCHDELRLPLYAQILGLPLVDTGLRRSWHDRDEDRVFNVIPLEIERSAIASALADPAGPRAFHPFRRIFRDARR